MASLFMVIGALLLYSLFIFPLWNIQLGAPQYPEPLGLNIYIDGIEGQSEFDIQNIDGLNHYIGMKTLPKPSDMWEFNVFPIVIGIMIGLGILIGILGFFNKVNFHWFLGWFVVMSILGILGMYDFNAWMVDYGTNLDPKAIIKLQNPDGTPMSYKPPLYGHKKLLNFDAYSYPRIGGYLMGVGMFFTLIAFIIGKRAKSRKMGNYKTIPLAAIMLILLVSCSKDPQPIDYGNDGCHYCKMTIVDKIHAAEIVTEKGKVFKFDATECMLNYVHNDQDVNVRKFYTNYYENPTDLMSSEAATFLISQGIPSPMGANLTAFMDREMAEKVKGEKGGICYSWEELKKHLK